MLLQEIYRDDPWKMLIGCILLNLTGRTHAQPVAEELFRRWPRPVDMARASVEEIGEVVRCLGLWRRRADTLKVFSHQWTFAQEVEEQWPLPEKKVRAMKGIGPYAADSYRFFILDDFSRFDSGDFVLLKYLKARREGKL